MFGGMIQACCILLDELYPGVPNIVACSLTIEQHPLHRVSNDI